MFQPKLIFVYGTLKQGYHNHSLLKGATYLGEDKLRINGLYGTGFPFASFTEEADAPWLKGEVYRVSSNDTLLNLDRLEGHPNWYVRKQFTTEGGKEVEAYHFKEAKDNLVADYRVGRNVYEWNRAY